jgi:hypothetical protein
MGEQQRYLHQQKVREEEERRNIENQRSKGSQREN